MRLLIVAVIKDSPIGNWLNNLLFIHLEQYYAAGKNEEDCYHLDRYIDDR